MDHEILFQQMPDMVVYRGPDRKIQLVNQAFVDAFGQSAQHWIGQEMHGSVSGAQIGAFDENRAYGHILIAEELHWVEWIEVALADGGTLAMGRLNADRRSIMRVASAHQTERRKNQLPAFNTKIEDIPEPQNQSQDAQPQRSTAPAAKPAIAVLLAEDDLLNAKLARTLLERSGCVVTHVENGEEAVALAQTRDFDLVFMDVRMPKMDGLLATKAIRALGGSWADTPIVALTANAFAEDRTACHAAGMNGFLTKPITIDALASAQKRWTNPQNNARTA